MQHPSQMNMRKPQMSTEQRIPVQQPPPKDAQLTHRNRSRCHVQQNTPFSMLLRQITTVQPQKRMPRTDNAVNDHGATEATYRPVQRTTPIRTPTPQLNTAATAAASNTTVR